MVCCSEGVGVRGRVEGFEVNFEVKQGGEREDIPGYLLLIHKRIPAAHIPARTPANGPGLWDVCAAGFSGTTTGASIVGVGVGSKVGSGVGSAVSQIDVPCDEELLLRFFGMNLCTQTANENESSKDRESVYA